MNILALILVVSDEEITITDRVQPRMDKIKDKIGGHHP